MHYNLRGMLLTLRVPLDLCSLLIHCGCILQVLDREQQDLCLGQGGKTCLGGRGQYINAAPVLTYGRWSPW